MHFRWAVREQEPRSTQHQVCPAPRTVGKLLGRSVIVGKLRTHPLLLALEGKKLLAAAEAAEDMRVAGLFWSACSFALT